MPEGESPTGRQSTAGTSRHPNCPAHRQQQHARRLSAAVRTAADCRQTRAARSTLQLSVPLDRAQRSQIPPSAPTTTAMRHATSAKGPGRPAGGRAAAGPRGGSGQARFTRLRRSASARRPRTLAAPIGRPLARRDVQRSQPTQRTRGCSARRLGGQPHPPFQVLLDASRASVAGHPKSARGDGRT